MSDLTDEDIARAEQLSEFCDEEFWSLLSEVKRHRAMVKRLEEFALSLEHAHHPDMRTVGDILRRRMRAP